VKIERTLVTLGTSAALALGLVGAVAPSASAQTQFPFWGGTASYTDSNLRSGDMASGNAQESPFGALMAPQGDPASCGSIERSTHTFTATCSGREWAVQVDCSDGSRYMTPAMTGPHRVSLSCPYGTRVSDGGAYER
jgi:hypothetical protein